jgi:hypothetical protein
MRYELAAINFHLGESRARERKGRGHERRQAALHHYVRVRVRIMKLS